MFRDPRGLVEKSERSVSKIVTLCMGRSQVPKVNNICTAIAPRNRVEVGNSCSPRSWLRMLAEKIHGRKGHSRSELHRSRSDMALMEK